MTTETTYYLKRLAAATTERLRPWLFEHKNPAFPPRVYTVSKKDISNCTIPDSLKNVNIFTVYDLDLLNKAFETDGDVLTSMSGGAGDTAVVLSAELFGRLKDPQNWGKLVDVMAYASGKAGTEKVPHIYPDAINLCLTPKTIPRSFICDKKLYVDPGCGTPVDCEVSKHNSYNDVLDRVNSCIAGSDLPAIVSVREFLENNTDLDSHDKKNNDNNKKPVTHDILDWLRDNWKLATGVGAGILILLLIIIWLARR